MFDLPTFLGPNSYITTHQTTAWNKFTQQQHAGKSHKTNVASQITHPHDVLAARVYTLEVQELEEGRGKEEEEKRVKNMNHCLILFLTDTQNLPCSKYVPAGSAVG